MTHQQARIFLDRVIDRSLEIQERLASNLIESAVQLKHEIQSVFRFEDSKEMESFLPHKEVKPVIIAAATGNTNSLLNFYEYGLRQQYPNQSDHFRSLVSEHNRLMPLLIAVQKIESLKLADDKFYLAVRHLQSVVSGFNLRNRCDSCGSIKMAKHLKEHIRRCPTQLASIKIKRQILSLGDSEHYCPLEGSSFTTLG